MSWLISGALMKAYENSHSLPERAEAFLEGNCLDGEQCAQSSTSPMPQAYLSPDRMTDFSRLSRFGITFAPLTGSLGEELLTWYLEVFRVNHSAQQEGAKDRKTSGNCSGKLLALFKKSDPNISFSKMSLASSLHDPRLAYVGGLIDGEGCIRIQRQRNKNTYIPVVQITMSDKASALLEEMRKAFGGRLYSQGYPKKKNWMSQTMWRMNGAQAVRFLRMVQPYLMLKHQQCALAISLHEMKESQGWTKATRKHASEMKGKMHKLNQRGSIARNAGDFYEPMPDLFGTWHPFSGPFPSWGTLVDGELREQPTLVPRTNGRGSGLWPTIRASDGERGGRGDVNQDDPRNGLVGAVRKFPTPTCHDRKGESGAVRGKNAKGGPTLTETVGGTLNPGFVEWLMNWPINWTSLEPITLREESWCSEPEDVPRTADRTPDSTPRLKAIGNGQVPLCAATTWRILHNQIEGDNQ